jgi:hypothetical protein
MIATADGDRPQAGPPIGMATTCLPDPQFDLDVGGTLDLMTQVVRSRGAGYVDRPVWINRDEYLSCTYAHAGLPRCLVGEVLFRAGVGVDELETLGDSAIFDVYRARRLPITMTLGAVLVLRRAQIAQDRGCSWGEVLDEATAEASKLVELIRPPALEHRAGARE